MSQNIILIGMRGSGKSHLGSIFAKKYSYDFLDTDDAIEQKAGKKIAKIVEEGGWELFRKKEEALCRELGTAQNTVISVGGGTVLNPKNVVQLKKNGICVFLFVPLKELHRRLKKSKNKRPPLKPGLSLRQEIQAIWKERKEIFAEVADIVFASTFISPNPHKNVATNTELLADLLRAEGILQEGL